MKSLTLTSTGRRCGHERLLTLLAAIAILAAICGVRAEDAKTPSPAERDELLQERPDTLPADTMREPGTTDAGHESNEKITGPITREDVIRDVFRNRPSGKSAGPAGPVPELTPR